MTSRHSQALLALILCALLWSTGGMLIKTIPLSPLAIAGSRSAIAACVMLAWHLMRERAFRPSWSIAQIGSIISYALTVILFVMATKFTTAANAILLQYTAPVWVALFSTVVARERLRATDIAVVSIVMMGMVVFFLDTLTPGAVTGNIIAVASGVAFAGVALCMRAQRGKSTTESIILGNILTAIVCLPLTGSLAVDADALTRLIILGVFQLGVSYILYAWALAHVSAIEAVLITVLEPLLNPIWVGLVTGETPSTTAIVGGIIVVTAVVARNFVNARTAHTQSGA
jgi:drug/metabolite transporter (DMT)-like permease